MICTELYQFSAKKKNLEYDQVTSMPELGLVDRPINLLVEVLTRQIK